MNIITYLQTILSAISSVLLYPVIILLIGLLVMLIITKSRFFGEYLKVANITPNILILVPITLCIFYFNAAYY